MDAAHPHQHQHAAHWTRPVRQVLGLRISLERQRCSMFLQRAFHTNMFYVPICCKKLFPYIFLHRGTLLNTTHCYANDAFWTMPR